MNPHLLGDIWSVPSISKMEMHWHKLVHTFPTACDLERSQGWEKMMRKGLGEVT